MSFKEKFGLKIHFFCYFLVCVFFLELIGVCLFEFQQFLLVLAVDLMRLSAKFKLCRLISIFKL